jgi:FAD-dependent urate hydroxylase
VIGQSLERIGHRLEHVVTRTKEGAPLAGMPVGDFKRKPGAPVYPVSRTDLQAILVDAVGADNLHLGANCIGVEQNTSAATVYFADGREATGDVVVGADGIHSVILRAIAGDVAPRYSGIANWVGIITNDSVQPEHTEYEYLGEGKRCGVVPLAGDRVLFGLGCAMEEGSPPPDGGRGRQLCALFGDWPAPIPASLSAARNET